MEKIIDDYVCFKTHDDQAIPSIGTQAELIVLLIVSKYY